MWHESQVRQSRMTQRTVRRTGEAKVSGLRDTETLGPRVVMSKSDLERLSRDLRFSLRTATVTPGELSPLDPIVPR